MCQPHKAVKHTQTIRRQIADKLFERVSPFCWGSFKGVIMAEINILTFSFETNILSA